ncbi:MAG: DedD protein [Pseudomonadota bacterium]|nr:DedD protein [Pseudomonadota bacterium]
MERSLQQRLLGAAILLAVLVIVVPELLDGAGHRSRYPSSIDIPEEPEFKPLPDTEPLPIGQPDIVAQPVPENVADEPSVAAVTTEQPVAVPTAVPAAEKTDAVEVVSRQVVEKKNSTSAKKPVTAAKPVWALQIGSFGDKKNALKMRDQYRAKGFAAYVDDEKGVFRVRIGPELDRQRIEKLQERIFKQENIRGMIVNK